jgi:hypothetical protein
VRQQDADRRLDSASSGGDGSSDMANSDECCTGADRTTPSTASRSSSRGDKASQPMSKSSSPVPSIVKTEGTMAAEPEPMDGVVTCDLQKPVPCKTDGAGEQWKVPDVKIDSRDEGGKDWKLVTGDRLPEAEKLPQVAFPMETTVKREVGEPDERSMRDLPPVVPLVKSEDVMDGHGSPMPHGQWQDVKTAQTSRAVASVAPCQSLAPGSVSPWKSGSAVVLPPPLLLPHSASVQPVSMECCSSPNVTPGPGAPNDVGQMFETGSDESDPETHARSPSPEQRPINEKCYSSKNAMYVCLHEVVKP